MSKSHQYKFLRQAPKDGTSMQMRAPLAQRLHLDPWLIGLLLMAMCFGLVTLYSSSGQDVEMVVKQALSFCIAFGIMIGIAQIPPKVYQSFSPWFYIIGIVLLLLVMVVGDVRLGARRWLKIPGFGSVQPSEFMKLGMPMMVAWFAASRPTPPSLKNVAIALGIIIVPTLLVAQQPDLGTSLLVMGSGLFVLFFSGLQWWIIGGFALAISAFSPIAWFFLLHDYQKQRVITFLNPEADVLGKGWNIVQSKAAIGSGGISGKGYLMGTQSHLHFLPEGHTDFAIAAFSEEFGLVGVFLLCLLYVCIILRAMQIAMNSKERFSRLLVGALGMSFFIYVFINMGMVSGILPVVGVPLPFMSYGGTALITLLAGFGLMMSVQTHR